MRIFRGVAAVGYAAIGFYFSVLSSMYAEFSLAGLFSLVLPALLLVVTLAPAAFSAWHLLQVRFENVRLCKWMWVCPLLLLLLSAAVPFLMPAARLGELPSFLSTLLLSTVEYYWGFSLYLPLLFQVLALIAVLPICEKENSVIS